MRIKYTERMHDFIKQNHYGVPADEFAEILNAEFPGNKFTESIVRSYRKNHKLSSGCPKGYANLYQKWPKEVHDFLRANITGKTSAETAELVRKEFDIEFTADQVRSYRKNHHIPCGVKTTFKPGHISYNKGKHIKQHPNAIRTRFQKGHSPNNKCPIGEIRKTKDGYLIKKVKEFGPQWDRWKFLHRLVWEEHNGPIPDGMVVIFLDGNKENCNIKNLELISTAEHNLMRLRKLRYSDPELTATGINIVRLEHAISVKRKKMK